MASPPRSPGEVRARLQESLAGRYRIRQEIGRGGMATVFLADDLKLGRPVAIKLLSPTVAQALGPERFRREIDILAGLSHPNILPLHDSGEADGLLFFVAPFVTGESLRERLRSHPQLPQPDALRIARELADALAYAHGRGVIHRDLKPSNILLSGEHAILADFGIARSGEGGLEGAITESGLAIGTPEYMSPEQSSGHDLVDARSDIYALGCVLFEMLAGEPPFTGTTVQAILAKHRRERVPSLRVVRPGVSSGLDNVIQKALAKIPADRYQSAEQFGRALAQAERAELADAGPGARRNRLLLAGVGLSLLLGAAALFLPLRRHGPPAGGGRLAPDPSRLAVLYFEDRSPEKSLGPIATGLTEDLINQFSQVAALHVISALGVRPFRGASVSPDSLSRALGVGTIISGSVDRSGRLIRASVQIVSAADNRQVFSETLQRPYDDLFTLRDQLADSLALSLRPRLGVEVRLRETLGQTRSLPAWERLQLASQLVQSAGRLRLANQLAASSEQLWEADSILTRAQALDPKWTAPRLERGQVAFTQSLLAAAGASAAGRPALTPERWLRQGIGQAEAALALAPGDARALQLRGTLRYQLYYEVINRPDSLPAAEADLRASVAAEPTLARGWAWLSSIYNHTGRFRESEEAARRALEADAYIEEGEQVVSRLFYTALDQERYEEARRWCQIAMARYDRVQRVGDCPLRILGWSGRGDRDLHEAAGWLARIEARDAVHRYDVFWVERRLLFAAILARSQSPDSARRVMTAALAAADPRMPPSDRDFLDYPHAYLELLLHNQSESLRLLRRYLTAMPSERGYVAQCAWFRPLHGDPEFQALVTSF